MYHLGLLSLGISKNQFGIFIGVHHRGFSCLPWPHFAPLWVLAGGHPWHSEVLFSLTGWAVSSPEGLRDRWDVLPWDMPVPLGQPRAWGLSRLDLISWLLKLTEMYAACFHMYATSFYSPRNVFMEKYVLAISFYWKNLLQICHYYQFSFSITPSSFLGFHIKIRFPYKMVVKQKMDHSSC